MKTINTKTQKTPWHLIVIFLILSIAIWTGGFFYYKHEKERIRQGLQKELTAIADLKVKEIADWRNEYMSGAEAIYSNPFMVRNVKLWLERGTPHQLRKEILEYMASLKKLYKYHSILLIDKKGTVRLSLPVESGKIGKHAQELFSEALSTQKVIFSDLHTAKHIKNIHIDFVIPLLAQKGNETLSFGAFLIRIDPYMFLYPLIQSWPTPSKTAETILVRREGNDVIFLNELRHRKNTALSFKIPIAKKDLPSVMAAGGYRGILDAVSYRGLPVLTVTRSIPETSWHLVAQVDAEEIYAPIREQFWVIALIVTLLITGSGISLGFIWHHQRADFYRRQYEMEHQHSALLERFEYLTRHANDIILLADENYNIVEANERAVQSYGYEQDELLQLQLNNLRTPEARELFDVQMEEVKTRNGFVFETEHQRKDGTTFPVEVSSRVIDIGGKKFYQYIIRDITERKKAEEELRRVNRALRTISECNQELVRITEEQTLLNEICKIIVTIGGYRLAWVGYAEHDEKKTVRPVVYAGHEEGFLERLHVTWADTEYGSGPSGTAIRTRRPAVFNDISLEPDLAPWREEALKHSYASVIGLPLIINSDSIGALTICAGELDAFHDDEVKLLTELANDLAYGISALRTREKNRLAEEALQESKARLQLQIDRMPIGCIIWSPDFRVITWNPAAEKIFGFTADEVLGKHPYNLIVPKDAQPHVDTIWRRLLEGDTTAYSVNENTTKDGRVITCDWSNTPLKDDGTVIGVLSMVQDITERKQAEEKLNLEKNRFVAASLAGRVALWGWNLRSSVVEWSDIVDSMLGYETGEFPRTIQAWEELIHPDDRPHVMQMLERHLEQGTPYDTEYRVRTKEGSYIWWRDTGTCKRDEHGKAYQMSGACTDITERKQTEEELKKYRDHLEELVKERTADLEQASEALLQSERKLTIRNKIANIFLTANTDEEMYNDVLNVILEFMESKYGVIGYIDEDGSLVVPSMSRHIWDKCQVPDKTHVFPRDKWGDSSWPRAIREKKTNYTNKVSSLTPEGHIAVSKHISLPIIYQGEVIGLIQIANKETDYTDKDIQLLESLGNIIAPILNARLQRDRQAKARRQAEESLRIVNASLIEQAEELEQQKTDAEVARLQAETATRAKSDFLANMSHELRTPLNSIIGFSEILQDEMYGNLNAQQKEYVNDVLTSGQHLLNLINDILDLSKVESGKMELELTTFPLLGVLEMSKVMFKEKALKHNITLSLKVEPDADIEIKADERKLKQVLFNLVGNAMKFTPDGGSVNINAQRIVDSIEISVEDTGVGIKPEDMDKLFTEFTQLESAYEKKYQGTGLGLALTKKLVELHGGKIWAESEYGKRSRFTFVIPIKQDA